MSAPESAETAHPPYTMDLDKVTITPEPGTFLAVAGGLGVLAAYGRRRKS
ncbi:MAG: PEP-CTERM sorting domain-containing protein [Myxococcota bacterium]|nr:PEP-CTERM sorting domain-containing protein [Myxococcota bacterium]